MDFKITILSVSLVYFAISVTTSSMIDKSIPDSSYFIGVGRPTKINSDFLTTSSKGKVSLYLSKKRIVSLPAEATLKPFATACPTNP